MALHLVFNFTVLQCTAVKRFTHTIQLWILHCISSNSVLHELLLYYIVCIVHCILYIVNCILYCGKTQAYRVGILSHWLDYVCTMYCIVLCVLCICIVLYCVLCIVMYFVLWEDTGRQGGHIEPLAGPRLPPICLCLSCRSDFFPFLCFSSLSLSLSLSL